MKKEVIHIALENLRQIAGVEAFWQETGPLDGVLDFTVNEQTFTFVVEVKREMRTHQLQQNEDKLV